MIPISQNCFKVICFKPLVTARHSSGDLSQARERIASVCKQLKLPAPMQKIYTPVALRLLLQTGKDVATCPVCGKGRMKLVKTFIFHNGALTDIALIRNRGSPKTKGKYAAGDKSI
jgi:hypothetical protein